MYGRDSGTYPKVRYVWTSAFNIIWDILYVKKLSKASF